VARTGHPTKLLGNFTRNVRVRENLPFNVHPLDVVFAATPVIHWPLANVRLTVPGYSMPTRDDS